MRNGSARLCGCTRIYADPQVPYFSHTNLSTNQNQCTIDMVNLHCTVRVGCYKQWKKRFAVISDIIIGLQVSHVTFSEISAADQDGKLLATNWDVFQRFKRRF